MIKILIVDDHILVSTAIQRLLSNQPDIKVIGTANNGEEALQQVRRLNPDVILMDIKMPGMGGIEATRKILRLQPTVRIIALSAYDDNHYPSRLLQAGAAGYLIKGSGIEETVTAIRAVYAGQCYISSDMAQQLAIKRISPQTDKSPFDLLSERELRVTLLVTTGCSVHTIAEQLHLTPKTIQDYRHRIFKKLQIHNDVGLTHLAMHYGLINLE